MPENPYAPPQTPLDAKTPDTEEEKVRKEYLYHEASIHSIGYIYCIAGFITIIVGVCLVLKQFMRFDPYILCWGLGSIVIGNFQIFVGIGVVRLQQWSRLPAGTYGVLYLFLLLIVDPRLSLIAGGAFTAYVIAIIFGEKGQMVFSEYYQQIIRETPHIKYRTSPIAWIMLFLVIGFILFLMGVSLVNRL